MEPAYTTPLPWKYPQQGVAEIRCCEGRIAMVLGPKAPTNAAYIAHACNAYPRLIDALRSQIADLEAVYDQAKGRKSGVEVSLGMFRRLNAARALLAELGE